MFAAKLAVPCPVTDSLPQAQADRVMAGTVTLFSVPPGYLLTENLAAMIEASQRKCIWLRINAEDRDPGAFLLSLIAASQQFGQEIGSVTRAQMRQHPGPIGGWAPLFAQLGQELQSLNTPCAIVIENVQHLTITHPTLELFCRYLFPALPSGTSLILIGKSAAPRGALPQQTVYYDRGQLRVNLRAALELAERANANCATSSVQRALALFDGRAVALRGFFAACSRLGSQFAKQSVDSARDCDDLLARIARAWLTASDRESLEALALAIQLEYTRPGLSQIVLGHGNVPTLPWLQPLTEDWVRLRQVWHPALTAAMSLRVALNAEQLQRAADFLLKEGATEQAISLYLELGNASRAAEVIAEQADALLDLGQWETLTGWLNRLPTHVLHGYPWLIHVQGEIAAAQGDGKTARRTFAVATGLFSLRNDRDGACSSLLAESAIARQDGNLSQAQASARAALGMAQTFNLAWHQCWAAWQIGSLLVTSNQFDDALIFFELAARAAEQITEPLLDELSRTALELSTNQRAFKRERESLRQMYLDLEQRDQETAEQLRQLMERPTRQLDQFVARHGWSHTPLVVKLPALAAGAPILNSALRTSLWQFLSSAVNLRRTIATRTNRSRAAPLADLMDSFSEAQPAPDTNASAISIPLVFAPTTEITLETDGASSASVETDTANLARQNEIANFQLVQVPSLVVYVLGAFRVAFNDTLIENLPIGKGRTLFKYLVTHHDKPVTRDILMDLLWSEAGPEAARNRLNVALHGLRQALRSTAQTPIVLFEDNGYRLNPELHIWLDMEDFEKHVQAGRQLEAKGDVPATVVEYELAAGLYQGDFLEDDLYEDWMVLTRERLRGDYLDILDRLSRIHFAQEEYAISATMCKLILARDNCSEPAHRRLMRCYSRQGQQYLALRQYQACVEALRTELNIDPAAETAQLYENIRRSLPI